MFIKIKMPFTYKYNWCWYGFLLQAKRFSSDGLGSNEPKEFMFIKIKMPFTYKYNWCWYGFLLQAKRLSSDGLGSNELVPPPSPTAKHFISWLTPTEHV